MAVPGKAAVVCTLRVLRVMHERVHFQDTSAGLSVEYGAGGYLTTHRRLPEILVEVIA